MGKDCIDLVYNLEDVSIIIKLDTDGIKIVPSINKEVLNKKTHTLKENISITINNKSFEVKNDQQLFFDIISSENFNINSINEIISNLKKIQQENKNIKELLKSVIKKLDVLYKINNTLKKFKEVDKRVLYNYINNLKDNPSETDNVELQLSILNKLEADKEIILNNKDIFNSLSSDYKKNVLGINEVSYLNNNISEIKYSLKALKAEINTTFDIEASDIKYIGKDSLEIYKSFKDSLNNSINTIISNIDKLAKGGVIFENELYSGIFSLRKSKKIIEVATSLTSLIDSFSRNFENILGNTEELLTKTNIQSNILGIKHISDLNAKIERIFNTEVNDLNKDTIIEDIELLINAYDNNNLGDIIGNVMQMYDTINIINNLFESLLSNNVLDEIEREKIDYNDPISIDMRDVYTNQKKLLERLRNKKNISLNKIDKELVVNISSYVSAINNLRFNYKRLKFLKEQNGEPITSNDIKKILYFSNFKNILHDIDYVDLEGVTFNQTEVAQLGGLKYMFDKKMFELKRINEEDLNRINNKYNYFLQKFNNDKKLLDNVMYKLFETNNGVRTGYLINKYDDSYFIEAEDLFRKNGTNNRLKSLYKVIYEETSYGEGIDYIMNNKNEMGIEYLLDFEINNNLFNSNNSLERREFIYEEYIKKHSNINYIGNSKNSFNTNNVLKLKNENLSIKDYLDLIEMRINDYYEKQRKVIDKNGKRVYDDIYIDELKEFISNNIKNLRAYFEGTYDINTTLISNITLLEFSKIVNSFMTLLDRYDIQNNLMYLRDENDSIDEKLRNAKSVTESKKILTDISKYEKMYKFNIGYSRNKIKYINTDYSKSYKEYLSTYSDKSLLEELYDYVREELSELNNGLDLVNQYSRFEKKLFAFQSEKSLEEKYKTKGIGSIIKENINDIFKETASSSHVFHLNNGTSLVLPKRTSRLTITEENLSNNIFTNLMVATLEKNKYENMLELIGEAKSAINALEQMSVNTGSGVQQLKRIPEKIKNKIEVLYGINKKNVVEKPVVTLTEEGNLKIEKKHAKDQYFYLTYNRFIDEISRKSLDKIYENIGLTSSTLLENFNIELNTENKYKQNISAKDLKDFLKNIKDFYNDLYINKKQMYKYFHDTNEFFYTITYQFILDNAGLKKAIEDDLIVKGIKQSITDYLDSLNAIEYVNYLYDILDKNIQYEVNVSNGVYSIDDIDPKSEAVKNFFTKAYYVDALGNKIPIENYTIDSYQKNSSIEKIDHKKLNLNFTKLRIEDLNKIMLNMMAKINYTKSIELDKVIEMEQLRTIENYKVFSPDKAVSDITSATASAILNLGVMTFIGEMSYGLIGLINKGISSKTFSIFDISTSLVNGLSYTIFGAVSTNKKIEKIHSLLNREDFINKVPEDSEYYKNLSNKGTLDFLSKGYNNFKHILGIIPNKLYRNVVMNMVAKKIYVKVKDKAGNIVTLNILDCFDSNGNQLYEINDDDLIRFINLYDTTLREVTLYNNDSIEVNRNAWKKALLLFKNFFLNMYKIYFGNAKEEHLFSDEMRRGIFMSLIGKGSLFYNNDGRLDLYSVIPKLMSVIKGDKGMFRYKTDIENLRRIGTHLLIIGSIYAILGTIEGDLYDEEETYIEDEDGNRVKVRRRRRKKVKANDLSYMYAFLARVYRENVMMYDTDNTLGFLGNYTLAQLSYISNYIELMEHTITQERYATGVYKGKYKWEIDLMQTNYIGNFLLRLETMDKNTKLNY